jgi:hypothetical protein
MPAAIAMTPTETDRHAPARCLGDDAGDGTPDDAGHRVEADDRRHRAPALAIREQSPNERVAFGKMSDAPMPASARRPERLKVGASAGRGS